MTLKSFLAMLVRKWYLVIVVPLIVGFACFHCITNAHMRYEAIAIVEISNNLADANTIAGNAIRNTPHEKTRLTRYGVPRSKEIRFVARDTSSKRCLKTVNAACETFQKLIEELDSEITITSSTNATSSREVPLSSNVFLYVSSAVAISLALIVAGLLLWNGRREQKSDSGRSCTKLKAMLYHDDNNRELQDHSKVEVFSNSHERITVGKVIRNILYLALALSIAVSTNSLYFILPHTDTIVYAIIIGISSFIIAWHWTESPISSRFLQMWAIWLAALVIIYSLVALFSRQYGYDGLRLFLVALALFPLLIHTSKQRGEFSYLVTSLPSVMGVLGALSLVLWIVGPLMNFFPANCSIEYRWIPTAVEKYPTVDGYFHLLYESQKTSVFGHSVWRNTGIYPESPMYAYALGAALCFELFLSEKPRRFIVVSLILTLISTVSTTGLTLIFIITIIEACTKLPKKRVAIAIPIILAFTVLAVVIVSAKISLSSGMTHIDDYVACFRAWLESPVFGNGFDNEAAIRGFMGDFRSKNPGLSNSFGYILATGGLAYLSIHIAAFSGFFLKSTWKHKSAGVCLFLIWSVTIATRLPLTALMLSIGIERVSALLPPKNLTE